MDSHRRFSASVIDIIQMRVQFVKNFQQKFQKM